MKCSLKTTLAILVVAACGRDGAITEPDARDALLPPGVLAIGVDPTTGARIETNKDDYLPGEIVHVTGAGWAPGETVNLHMTEMPDTHADVDSNVVADANGTFSVHYYDVQPHDLGVTFTLTATGQTSGSVAVATFRDGDIQVEIAPAFYPTAAAGTVRRFSVLVRQVNTTQTKCIKITVPYTATFISVTGSTAGWSGPPAAGNVVTVTSANALTTTSDWVRVEVDATPPATSNGDWLTQAWTDVACTASPGNQDDPVVNIGSPQNWTYAADFRDAGDAVVAAETGTAGAPKTYRLRLTNTSGSGGDKGIFAVIALPPCFSSPNGTVALSTNNPSKPFTASVHGTVIRLTGGELEKNSSHYVQVEFTTTPQNGCGTTFNTAMWKSAEHNSSENDTFVGNHPSITLGAAAASTETTVSGSPDPSLHGQSVTITADVEEASSTTAVTAGNVEFRIGSTSCSDGTVLPGGPFALNGSGQASTSRTFTFAEDNSNIRACYLGATGFAASNGTYVQDVDKSPTTTTVDDNIETSSVGQTVIFTVTVAATGGGVGTPTGTVTLWRLTSGTCTVSPAGQNLGSALLVGGTVNINVSNLPSGTNTVTACYPGDGSFVSSDGTDTHNVDLIATQTAIVSSVNPSVTGQGTVFTATVTQTAGGAVGTGNVTFKTGGTNCGDAALLSGPTAVNASGQAATTSQTYLATQSGLVVRACYAEGTTYASSEGSVTQTVNKATTLVTLTDSPDPSVSGESVTLGATVTAVAPGIGTPTGTVTFYASGTCAAPGAALGSATASPWSVSTTLLTAAGSPYTLLACYGGDDNFLANSDTETHTVNQANVLVSVSDNPTSSVFGQSVTFTATVTAVAPGAGTPAGTVTFYEFTGGQTCTLPNGATGSADTESPWQFTTSSLSVGAHTITACYGGDATFNANSGTDTHTVSHANVLVTVTDNPTSSQFGQSVTFTAVLTAVAPGAGTPTGTVTFYEFGAGQSCGSPGAATGIAAASAPYQFTTSTLAVGTHTITACYGGNGNFNGNEGSDTHTVAAKSTTLAVAPSTQQYSDKSVLTATILPHTVNSSALTGTVRFYVETAAVNCAAPGGAVAVGNDPIVDADDGVGSFTYPIAKQPSATAYVVTACFESTNTNFQNSDDTESLTVTKEDASVFDAVVPSGLQIPNTGGTLTFKIRETFGSTATEKNSAQQKTDGLVAPGNIDVTAMGVTVSLKGILNGVQFNNLACTLPPASNGGTGYAEILTVSCTVPAIETADTYEVDIDVSSDHYVGEGVAIIQVTDPNAGFATGGGWYWYDKTNYPGEKVNFGFMAKSSVNNKKTVYQGSLLVIRHKADGTVIKIKSNVFEGYTIKTNVVCPQVTFSGKANYSVDGSSLGNFAFTGFGEDCGEPGTADKFGLWHGYSPNGVSTSATLSGLVGSAKVLEGGNVQVPQPSRR